MAPAQVKVYSTLSDDQIFLDDYVTYRLIIEKAEDVKSVSPPAFKNFTIITGPLEEKGFLDAFGKTIRYISLVYVLKPKKQGRLKIEPPVASVNGRNIMGSMVYLEVLKGSSGIGSSAGIRDPFNAPPPYSQYQDFVLRKGDSISEKIKRNMVMRLEINKKSCFVGEPIVATYKLYSRLKGECKLTENPSFNGFSVIDLQPADATDFGEGSLNGRSFNVYTIRKAQLYPLQSGAISLESAEVENDLQFVKEEYVSRLSNGGGLFNDLSGSVPSAAIINQKVILKSQPESITVKPLPELNKPRGFKGAVGAFSINATVEKSAISKDEAGKLIVIIAGKGNMQLITAPEINWPNGVEAFEPAFSEKLIKTAVPISGEKRFEYSFSSLDTGTVTIPPIRFSYFDPVAEVYKTVQSEALVFQIEKSKGMPLANIVQSYQQPSMLFKLFQNRLLVVVIIAIILFSGLAIWLIRDKKAGQNSGKGQALGNAVVSDRTDDVIDTGQKFFPESEKCLSENSCNKFYQLINSELKSFFSRRFLVDQLSVNSNTIAAILDKNGVSNELAIRIQGIMSSIEWQLYTPFERSDKMSGIYSDCQEIVQLINAEQKTKYQ